MSRRVTADDIRGVVGIIPTPALPGADSPTAVSTVDLEETARLVENVVTAGVNVLMTTGTFGEVATLTEDELLAFADTVVKVVDGRIPVMVGPTAPNTRDTIRRGAALMALGADGLFVGRPSWLPLDDHQIVDYYRAVADALPDAALVAYDNPGVFKGKISTTAYAGLATIPQIVAAKYTGGKSTETFGADLAALDGRFALLPLVENWVSMVKAFPGQVHAAWTGDAACGPEPLVALSEALRTRNWDVAERIDEELEWALEPLFPDGDLAKFMAYSIQIDRAKFIGSGYSNPGPTRHPYTTAPEEYIAGGTEAGRRWATIRARYVAGAATEGATLV
ncbi:dihydrodipicolinate synthase family protein [Georgenia sp. SYP-B2076]|uniref:dihydrodipicolinate synthase family protein n=1 Tax=Georgenia sp. SYP-B2076 TaxID=2495881 RepID=UPI000F8E52C7|nr:dihydrodipicolinate synthase family protein [Georgenia sp. SYP-B2076]